MFKNIFKIKNNKIGLEKAKELGLITEEEFLRLAKWRADKELDDFENKNKKKNKNKK